LTFISFICIFGIGWACSSLFSYILNLGSSIILLKAVLAETLLFVINVVQDVHDLQALKRYELERLGKTESQLKLQERMDQKEINIFKRKIVRTIKSNFPKSFSHLVDFDDWDTLMQNIKKQINKGG